MADIWPLWSINHMSNGLCRFWVCYDAFGPDLLSDVDMIFIQCRVPALFDSNGSSISFSFVYGYSSIPFSLVRIGDLFQHRRDSCFLVVSMPCLINYCIIRKEWWGVQIFHACNHKASRLSTQWRPLFKEGINLLRTIGYYPLSSKSHLLA